MHQRKIQVIINYCLGLGIFLCGQEGYGGASHITQIANDTVVLCIFVMDLPGTSWLSTMLTLLYRWPRRSRASSQDGLVALVSIINICACNSDIIVKSPGIRPEFGITQL